MPSPIHHLVTKKPTVNAVHLSPLRQQLMDYGRRHQWPHIRFGTYALGADTENVTDRRELWRVLAYCHQEMVNALADAIGLERGEQSA